VVFSDPRTDASRRDFTVNALFYDVRSKRVIDFVNGRDDIRKRLVRCVGDPDERLREDHLRMLRAVRFAAVLDFELERETAAAIHRCAPLAASIAPERVREELTRILVESPRAGDAIRLMDETGLLRVLLPEVDAMKGQEQPPRFHPEGDVFEHAVLMLNLMREPSPQLAFAALLHDVGKPGTARLDGDRIRFNRHAAQGSELAGSILKRLRFSNADTDAIVHMIRNHMRFIDVKKMRRATLRRFVAEPTFDLELELHRLDCLASHGQLDNYEFLQAYRQSLAHEPVLPSAWVSGRDIMELGPSEGPEVGRWKRIAYDAQIENRFKTRAELLQWLKTRIESEECGG
jgi:poly(A) polymerase